MTAALAAGAVAGATDAYLTSSVQGSYSLTTSPADGWPTAITPLRTTRPAPHERPSGASTTPRPVPAELPTTVADDPPPAPSGGADPTPELTPRPASPTAEPTSAGSDPATEPSVAPTTDEVEELETREEPVTLDESTTVPADSATP